MRITTMVNARFEMTFRPKDVKVLESKLRERAPVSVTQHGNYIIVSTSVPLAPGDTLEGLEAMLTNRLTSARNFIDEIIAARKQSELSQL